MTDMEMFTGLMVNAPVGAGVIIAVKMMLRAAKDERAELMGLIKEDLHQLTAAVTTLTVSISKCRIQEE